jgi:hypothetical protein
MTYKNHGMVSRDVLETNKTELTESKNKPNSNIQESANIQINVEGLLHQIKITSSNPHQTSKPVPKESSPKTAEN